MLATSEATLRHLMSEVVSAAHTCVDLDTKQPKPKSIEPTTLRMAALVALMIVSGDLVTISN